MYKTIMRLLWLTAILSGILLMIAHIVNYGSDKYGTVIGNQLVFAAHILLVFTFFGLFIYHGERNGLLGWLAMMLGVVGNIIVTSIVFVEIAQASIKTISDVLTTPDTQFIYTYGPLLFVIGMILLGVFIIREKELPAYTGYLLLAGTFIFAGASVVENYTLLIEMIGSIFTGVGFIAIGIETIKSSKKSHIK